METVSHGDHFIWRPLHMETTSHQIEDNLTLKHYTPNWRSFDMKTIRNHHQDLITKRPLITKILLDMKTS